MQVIRGWPVHSTPNFEEVFVMNVLIFSVTAGYGHIATAQAVSLALTARGAHVVTVDLYEHVSPTVQRMIGSGYTCLR